MGAQGARQVESGNEWGTPWWVVKDACAMLDITAFNLDPAATEANKKASQYFNREQDGLRQDWFGWVWLNPPFSRSLSLCEPECGRSSCMKRGSHLTEAQHGAKDFARKAVQELEAGRVEAIAWHGPVAPDTDWYGLLWPFVHERADYAGRIPYNDGKSGGTFPSQTLILKPERRATGQVPTILLPVQARVIKGDSK